MVLETTILSNKDFAMLRESSLGKSAVNRLAWENAYPGLQQLKTYTPQAKGRFGVKMVKLCCTNKNKKFEVENKEGDHYIDGQLGECKTAFGDFKGSEVWVRENTPGFWFNQIRPKQHGWKFVTFVCINRYEIHVLKIPRSVIEKGLREEGPLAGNVKSGHSGTEELWKVNLSKRKDKEIFDLFRFGHFILERTEVD